MQASNVAEKAPRFTKTIPTKIQSFLETLNQEGIVFHLEDLETPNTSIEEKAINILSDALEQASLLYAQCSDLTECAKALEKIQLAAAQAEKTHFVAHTPTTHRCQLITHKLENLCRHRFHQLKGMSLDLNQLRKTSPIRK